MVAAGAAAAWAAGAAGPCPQVAAQEAVEAVRVAAAATAPAHRSVRRGIPGIFLMDPDGSNARPLIKVKGAQSHGTPSWSHDGNWVAFDATPASFTRAEVYLYAVGGPQKGTLKNLGSGNCPTFSRDDAQLAFYLEPQNAAAGEPGVYLMRTDGTDRRFLCPGDHPKWSPDGKRILVNHQSASPAVLDEADVATGQVSKLLETKYAKVPGAVYSPDGTKLAFIGYLDTGLKRAELVVSDLPAAADRQAAVPPAAATRVVYAGKCGWIPNWSPDGKQLTFALWETRQGTGCEVANVVDVDGKRPPVKLKGADEGCSRTNEGEWSPDGKTMVIASDREFPAAQLADRPDPPASGL